MNEIKDTIEKTWLWDVDGVVADFVNHTFNSMGVHVDIEDITDHNLIRRFPDKAQLMRNLWATDEFWQTLPLIPGARNGIEAVRDAGWNVVWCSSPYYSNERWYTNRLKWLQRHFPWTTVKKFIAASDKYLVDGKRLTDDKERNLVQFEAKGREAIAMDQPWNRHVDVRRMTWDSVHEFI